MIVRMHLDSSVGVCVFSKDAASGGAVCLESPDPQSLKKLIEDLRRLTSRPPETFAAKLVGGAKSRGGDENVTAARKLLASFNIPVVGEDVGGEKNRLALFHTHSGRLQVAEEPSAGPPKADPAPRKRKVLIVDDSKTIRDLLVTILKEDPELEIVGQAANAREAQAIVERVRPDVISLDVFMPEMTGVEWLEKLLPRMAIPVVMISSLELKDGNEVFRALELGAIDYIQKPSFSERRQLAPVIREKIKNASFAKVRRSSLLHREAETRDKVQLPATAAAMRTVVAIGSSTGGTEALKEVLARLPERIPPIVIVQHIPPVFSAALAERLNGLCPFQVKEAEDGDLLEPSKVLIAPGGRHMRLKRADGGYAVQLTDEAPVNHHRPSVDYLFNSVAELAGANSVGIILTGMGADGARGLLNMKQKGARTFGQDEETSVVYGMPRAAALLGAVDEVHPLDRIPSALAKWLQRK